MYDMLEENRDRSFHIINPHGTDAKLSTFTFNATQPCFEDSLEYLRTHQLDPQRFGNLYILEARDLGGPDATDETEHLWEYTVACNADLAQVLDETLMWDG